MTDLTKTPLKPEEDVTGPFLPNDAVLIRELNFSYGDRPVSFKEGGLEAWGRTCVVVRLPEHALSTDVRHVYVYPQLR
mgnify:CR=1 FL=1